MSSRIFFTILTLLFTSFFLPSTQLPYLLSHFTHSQSTTRQRNMIILVQEWPAIHNGLQSKSSQFYIVPRTFEDWSPIILSVDEIPHHIKQVTLGRSLPGSQCLLFSLELEVHPSQPPRTQQAQLKDNDHVTRTDRDDTKI